MSENYKIFEELINLNLGDDNATITGCELETIAEGTYLKVYYNISEEYAKKYDLLFKTRILRITLKRAEYDEGLPVVSYADAQGVQSPNG